MTTSILIFISKCQRWPRILKWENLLTTIETLSESAGPYASDEKLFLLSGRQKSCLSNSSLKYLRYNKIISRQNKEVKVQLSSLANGGAKSSKVCSSERGC